MIHLTKVLRIPALVCALALFGGTNAVAQRQSTQAAEEPAACKTCKHNLDTDEHWFGGWFSGCTSGSNCYDCQALNACHDAPQAPFQCGVYHWLCGSTATLLESLDKALASPNAETAIVRVANASPRFVRVLASGYVIVKNCNGVIVAAQRLPSATTPRVAPRKILSATGRVPGATIQVRG